MIKNLFLKNDKEVVLEAVKQDKEAFHYVSEKLKNDKDIIKLI